MAVPIRTRASNFVYRGPTPDIGDAWVERVRAERAVFLTWELSDEERAAVAAGANLRLGIFYMEPIPPVSLGVDTLEALSDAGAALRDRALRALATSRGPEDSLQRPGWWVASFDMWQRLNIEHALDPDDGGVPTLLGRPLVTTEGANFLEFNAGQQPEAKA